MYFRQSGFAKAGSQSLGLRGFIQGTTIAPLIGEASLMKAKRSSSNGLVPGAIACLLLALSACSESQNENLQLAKVTSVPDASSERPVERVHLQGLRFKSNSTGLRSGSEAILDEAVGILQQEPDERVDVDAYYSREGHTKADQELAQQRANAVKAYFAAHGIASARIVARGFGGQDPSIKNGVSGERRQISSVEVLAFTSDGMPATNLAYLPPANSKVN
jgi:outer membrane protein OmpA-like peptidoglycan-associated protein